MTPDFKNWYESMQPIDKGIVDFYLGDGRSFLEHANDVLEIGSGWGMFSRILMNVNPNAVLTTIDKIPEPKKYAENTRGFESRIRRITADSKDVLKNFKPESFDLIYVDGDHGYEGFKYDYHEAIRIVRDGGTIICDDVAHPKNFENDYGILKHLCEELVSKGRGFNVLPVGHGIVFVHVHHREK